MVLFCYYGVVLIKYLQIEFYVLYCGCDIKFIFSLTQVCIFLPFGKNACSFSHTCVMGNFVSQQWSYAFFVRSFGCALFNLWGILKGVHSFEECKAEYELTT